MLSLGFYIIGSLLVVVILHYWSNPKCNGKLPPGSMGWQLLVETLPFFAPNTSLGISPFVKLTSIRILLSVITSENLHLEQMDVKNSVFTWRYGQREICSNQKNLCF